MDTAGQTPYYIVYEEKLRKNLDVITDVAKRAGVKIIMAFKANALWKTFPVFKEYRIECTTSSLNELTLGIRHLCPKVHSYCPAYTTQTINQYLCGSSHITFNSLGQWEQHKQTLQAYNAQHNASDYVSAGLRVNPKCSVIETDIYNPALPGSRFGIGASDLANGLPEGIEGLHFHALCESSSYDLERVLSAFEEQFGHLLPHVKWVNMGGGHLITRADYNREHLIKILKDFKARYPNLEVILEPGSAFTWQTGDLVTTVVDIVDNDGVKTAIIDASFACHMPDTLEMPYQPAVAESVDKNTPGATPYILGGNSCLSGDYCGPWYFAEPLKPGQTLTLCDMNHYTTVKTTMFNGIQHPDIRFKSRSGNVELLRHFTFEDYQARMS